MRFSIRELMLVTIIVAVCTTWWLERTKLEAEIVRLNEENDRLHNRLFPRISGRRDALPIGDY